MTAFNRALASAILTIPLAFNAYAAQHGIEKPYGSPAEAQTALDKACPLEKTMPSRQQHLACVTETARQAQTFAESFHAALFNAVGIKPDYKSEDFMARYVKMIDSWKTRLTNQTIPLKKLRQTAETKGQTEAVKQYTGKIDALEIDVFTIKNYAGNCYDQLNPIKDNPHASLSFAYTTAYGLPETCVNNAVKLSERYNIKIDKAEATRLQTHARKINEYYKTHPEIPGQPADPTKPGTKPSYI